MTITRQSLLERLQLLSNEELLALFHSGDLIDLAKDVAAEELRRRGVRPLEGCRRVARGQRG